MIVEIFHLDSTFYDNNTAGLIKHETQHAHLCTQTYLTQKVDLKLPVELIAI